MKAIEHYFHVVPFIILYKVVLTFKSVDETLVYIQMKAIELYFHVVLFIILAVQGGSRSLVCGWNPSVTQCDYKMKAIEHYFHVVTVDYTVQGGSNFLRFTFSAWLCGLSMRKMS